MTGFPKNRRSSSASHILLVVLMLGLTAVAGMLVLKLPNSGRESLRQRAAKLSVDGEQLYRAISSLSDESSASSPQSAALLAAAHGKPGEAAEILSNLTTTDPSNPELLNDLGVMYWRVGNETPSMRFKALTLFERSAALAPNALAPRSNRSMAYHKLALHDLATSASLHSTNYSFRGTGPPNKFDKEPTPLDDFQNALRVHDFPRAQKLVKRHADFFREKIIDAALNPQDIATADLLAEYVGYLGANGDMTMQAILAPLQMESRNQILEARRLVQNGLVDYFRSKPLESLRLYEMAERAVGNASAFDSLWIQLKKADSRARSARTDPEGRRNDVREIIDSLDHVIGRARDLHFDWLLGHALVSKGNVMNVSSKQDEILSVWNEAVRLLMSSGATKDTARPLYYIAYIHGLAGDTETSLSLAYRSLSVTDPNDPIRLGQIYLLLSFQVNRLGYAQFANPLARQALEEATKGLNPALVASAMPLLAATASKNADVRLAEQYLAEANRARDLITNESERASLDRALNLFCGQVSLRAKAFTAAETCLNNNLQVFKLEPKAAPYVYPETLLSLAQLNSTRGRLDDARQQLRLATQVIEENDAYFATPGLRMPFEGQRRNIYDTAIGFEYDVGDRDAAWGYMQRYRAKLFLELLQQMNPGVAGTLDRAIDRNRVQELIPEDVQVLEYAMLKDRLLIWLVSRDKFSSTEYSISREDLERKITEFVGHINNKDDVHASSEELYRVLVEPVAASLDPDRALAIIPDLALHRLNFAALYSPGTKKFLLEQYVLLESPSLTTLLSAGSAAPSRFPMVKFGARTDSVGVTEELHALDPFYPGAKEFNRSAAVRPAFLSSLGEALVFQYSGHSQDAADPLRSAILLDGQREGPNSVTAVDISRTRMRLNSVVILASCDSSVGNSRDGIGMRGLTSAFLISGAGSVVGSLWLVESKSTSQLVVDFHRNFAQKKLSVAASLRNAQLSLIKEGKHPYEWSGFVVTGNVSALR